MRYNSHVQLHALLLYDDILVDMMAHIRSDTTLFDVNAHYLPYDAGTTIIPARIRISVQILVLSFAFSWTLTDLFSMSSFGLVFVSEPFGWFFFLNSSKSFLPFEAPRRNSLTSSLYSLSGTWTRIILGRTILSSSFSASLKILEGKV